MFQFSKFYFVIWLQSPFFHISDLFPSASGIKLRDVIIPPHAIRGQDAKLQCRYDLEVMKNICLFI